MLKERIVQDRAKDSGRGVIGPSPSDIAEFNSHSGALFVRTRLALNTRDLIVPSLSGVGIVSLAGCAQPGQAESPSAIENLPSTLEQDLTAWIDKKFDDFYKDDNGKYVEAYDNTNLWQCYDLPSDWVKRFLKYPLNTIEHPGGAYQIFNLADNETKQFFNVIDLKEKPGTLPKKGNIVVWEDGFNAIGGHTGIATGKNENEKIEVFVQNDPAGNPTSVDTSKPLPSPLGSPSRLKTYTLDHVLGYLEPKVITSGSVLGAATSEIPTPEPTPVSIFVNPTPTSQEPIPTQVQNVENPQGYQTFDAPLYSISYPQGWDPVVGMDGQYFSKLEADGQHRYGVRIIIDTAKGYDAAQIAQAYYQSVGAWMKNVQVPRPFQMGGRDGYDFYGELISADILLWAEEDFIFVENGKAVIYAYKSNLSNKDEIRNVWLQMANTLQIK